MTRRVAACLLVACGFFAFVSQSECAEQVASTPISLDARRAYGYLLQICRIGPRPSGSNGMTQQQTLIVKHFEPFDARVRFQPFEATHPTTGQPVRMNNVIISWQPERKTRVLLACHYDTRPNADRDPPLRKGTFIGANDGASGVALFMEMAHHMKELDPLLGVDFVLFDGEELVYSGLTGDRGKYFLGSEHFAREYVKRKGQPGISRYVCGVLVDMIGDRRLNLYYEKNSMRMAPEVTKSVFDTATRLKVKGFIPRVRHEVRDDHLPLNEIAHIPTTDLIDFDYRYWHTSQDVPTNCSGTSMATVGNVLCEWLRTAPLLKTAATGETR